MMAVTGMVVRADFFIAPGVQRLAQVTDNNSPAAKAIQAAQKFIADRNVKGARESLQGLSTDPNIVHPEVLLAELLTEAGFDNDARVLLEELSGKEPARMDLYLAFCERAVRQQRWFEGWNLADVGLKSKVPEYWSPTFRQYVADRLWLLKAVCCEGRKDWKGAQQLYLGIKRSEKNELDVLAGLGRVSFHLGETNSAIEYFEILKKLKPKSDHPYLFLAQLNDLVGNLAEAEASYQQAMQKAEEGEVTRVRLAFARWLIVHNRPEGTLPLLKDPIVDSADNETERLYLQGLVARMEGRFGEAQELFSTLHRQDPSKFVVGNQLAIVLCESADESLRARSLQLAEGNVRSHSQSSEAWATLGWVQFRLGDSISAERSYANSAQLGPMSRDTLYYIWQLKQVAGDLSAAALLEKAFLEARGPNYFVHRQVGK